MEKNKTKRLHILHKTTYSYSWSVLYSIQQVRLIPRTEIFQKVLNWQLQTPTKYAKGLDHFGNTLCTFSLDRQHDKLTVTSSGDMELLDFTDGYLQDTAESVHPLPVVHCHRPIALRVPVRRQ